MTKIYDQHKAAFPHVSAYVVLDHKADRVATIAFKYPRDGAGRLYAYVHFFGLEMVRGFATGGGYDKHTAACNVASAKIKALAGRYAQGEEGDRFDRATLNRFILALSHNNGRTWENHLRQAGFTVLQAV